MDHPIIGITTYARDETDHFALPAAYIEAVRRAGGIPVLIPPGELHLDELLAGCDGVILSGGEDVDPRHYNGSPHPEILVDAERDATEIAMTRALVAGELPLLGICRGAQVVNVAMGGTLIEHLPDEVGESTLHRASLMEDIPHQVTIDPASRLAKIIGKTAVNAASWHHQAIRQPAPGFEIVARAPDGTIEAVEMPGHPWLIAIQWHPEITASEDQDQQRLFDELVSMARKYRSFLRIQSQKESIS